MLHQFFSCRLAKEPSCSISELRFRTMRTKSDPSITDVGADA